MTDIWFTSANICALPLRRQIWVRRRIIQAVKNRGFVLLQEIEPARYHRAARRQAARKNMTAYNNTHEVPILAPSEWEDDGTSATKVVDGKAGVSPNRYISELLTKVDGFPIAVEGVHPPSKPRHGVDHAEWRIANWNKNWAALQTRCAVRHSQGYWVFVGGDTNKTKPSKPHPLAVQVMGSGLDHLWVIPPVGHTVGVVQTQKIAATKTMDHPIVRALVRLT